MGKTLQAITDRASDPARAYQPGELADGRFADLTNPPSLAALKLHELLFKCAGAAVADDRWHQIDLAQLRAVVGMKNYDRRGLIDLFKELRGVVMEYDTERKTVIAGLLDVAKVQFEDGDGPTVVRWKFGEGFREVVAKSDYWAMIDRSASLAMTSRYALRLHEMIALRVNLERKASEVFKLDDLRARLGVPAGKLASWNNLNQFALKPALVEINHLARFTVTMTPVKRGRSVVAVQLEWDEKASGSRAEAKAELAQPRVGRQARRAGTMEAITAPEASMAARGPFPASGGISYGVWGDLAREHLPRPLPDLDRVAGDFRRWAAERDLALSATGVEKAFIGFCKKVGPAR
jgi:hypothetical protein